MMKIYKVKKRLPTLRFDTSLQKRMEQKTNFILLYYERTPRAFPNFENCSI